MCRPLSPVDLKSFDSEVLFICFLFLDFFDELLTWKMEKSHLGKQFLKKSRNTFFSQIDFLAQERSCIERKPH